MPSYIISLYFTRDKAGNSSISYFDMFLKKLISIFCYLVCLILLLELITPCDDYIKKICSRLFFTEFSALSEVDQYGYKGTPYAVLPAVRLNKYGFNDTDDYSKEKRPHTVRILCLGNSATFGFADQRHNWPYFLEELFKSHQLNVEVINTAFPGNAYTSLVKRFGDEYISFSPDIVLIYCGFIHYSAVPYREYTLKRRKIKKIINSSLLIKVYL